MIQSTLLPPPQLRHNPETVLTVNEVANNLNVSVASVRNWVKTGYLVRVSTNTISTASFLDFKNNVIGREKLTSRANKSQKDSHNHQQLLVRFQNLLNDGTIDGNSIATDYELSLSNSYKNKEGIYYTPLKIIHRFFDFLPDDRSDLTICDPCCGTGNFLVAALQHGFKRENIYGFDVDPLAVQIAKRRISEQTKCKTNNIILSDFLTMDKRIDDIKFDIILTNPPWGKKIVRSQRDILSETLKTGKSKDTSAFFFFACLQILKENGYLGILLQDAFFNIASFEYARKTALNLDIKGLVDFGKPFKGLLTKAKGLILQNRTACSENHIQCDANASHHYRSQSSFRSNPKSIINFSCSSEEHTVIEHLTNLEHITLTGQASYGLGIVTGNNKKYCIRQSQTGYMPVYRGADIQPNNLNEPSIFIPEDLSLYQQVAPVTLYQAKEKLVYRFISSNLVFYVDTKQRFLLNSANMLILNESFPITSHQLCAILNSKIINWFFKTVFQTHKVLRSDLESLPIHANYFRIHKHFSEELFLDYLGIEEVNNGTFRIKK